MSLILHLRVRRPITHTGLSYIDIITLVSSDNILASGFVVMEQGILTLCA